jgi:hypothetical protein
LASFRVIGIADTAKPQAAGGKCLRATRSWCDLSILAESELKDFPEEFVSDFG